MATVFRKDLLLALQSYNYGQNCQKLMQLLDAPGPLGPWPNQEGRSHEAEGCHENVPFRGFRLPCSASLGTQRAEPKGTTQTRSDPFC